MAETTLISLKKLPYRVELQAWHNLLMRGRQGKPMHQHPFTLAPLCCYNHKGEVMFQKPLWLIVIGERRMELSLLDIHEAYRQRSELEHFFRFGKRKLLLDKFQTPDDHREEHWWRLATLPYLQLWIANDVARALPRPWERYLPAYTNQTPTPTMTLRGMSRIIRADWNTGSAPQTPR